MPAAERNIEKFFFIYLLISPLLDIFSGAYIHVATKIVGERLTDLITPSLITRMVVLLLFAWYILSLRDKKSILTVLPIAVAWCASVAGEFLFAPAFSLFADMQYMAKFVYNIAVILVYWRLLQRSSWNREQLLNWFNWYISLTALILALSIHIPYMLGQGYSTYGDRFGYFGNRGFFYSGNDITAVLMMLAPIAVINYIMQPPLTPDRRLRLADLLPNNAERRRHLFYLMAPATALTALFAIGTKTAYIALAVTLVVLGWYFLRLKKKSGDGSQWRAFRLVVVAFIAIFIFMSLFGLIADFGETLRRLRSFMAEDPDMATFVLSGRWEKLQNAFAAYKEGGIFTWLIGIGRGTQRYIIEMDVFEVLFYYGIFGAATMLWLYVKLGMGVLTRFTRRVDAYSLACFISVGLTGAYLLAAGHVLFSVTSGFYFALMLVYSHLYFAGSTEEMKLI